MSIAEHAKQIYDDQLRVQLEASHFGKFVAIEPESKAYFMGQSFVEAAMAAKLAHPNHKAFVIWIGHEAAFHLGAGIS